MAEPANPHNDLMELNVRYEELSMSDQRIQLDEFARSLSGFAGLLGIVGNYAYTSRLAEKSDDWSVTVSAEARVERGSINLAVIISSISTIQPIADTLNSIASFKEMVCNLLGFIFSKREQSDMDKLLKFLSEREQSAGEMRIRLEQVRSEERRRHDEIMQEERRKNEERMQEERRKNEERMQEERFKFAQMKHEEVMQVITALTAATNLQAKNALHPVGRSCQKVCVYAQEDGEMTLVSEADEAVKRVVSKRRRCTTKENQFIEKEITLIFLALNRVNCTCTFILQDDLPDDEVPLRMVDPALMCRGVITDPVFLDEGPNPYTKAFDSEEEVTAQVRFSPVTKLYEFIKICDDA